VSLSPSPFPLMALRGQILELRSTRHSPSPLPSRLAPNKPRLPRPHRSQQPHLHQRQQYSLVIGRYPRNTPHHHNEAHTSTHGRRPQGPVCAAHSVRLLYEAQWLTTLRPIGTPSTSGRPPVVGTPSLRTGAQTPPSCSV